uniref:Retrovirus-related Pol polyprotein from transposon TNT 1-94 n=1 Tax=Cajanus cajan TaxID=3821 RepID=A0A151R183_CAJCA|nr:Retrovirus-related Pol polyprotein from transposon TNT 1-94 [Cajanus cajan]
MTVEHTTSPVQRCRRPPGWMADYKTGEGLFEDSPEANLTMFASGESDPTNFATVVQIPKWRQAMDEEMKTINKNDTWELMELPEGAKKVGVKWVYKTKRKENGEVDKYKARLVVKGYAQEYGVDYTEVFAPVARMETIRLVVALVAQKGWTLY